MSTRSCNLRLPGRGLGPVQCAGAVALSRSSRVCYSNALSVDPVHRGDRVGHFQRISGSATRLQVHDRRATGRSHRGRCPPGPPWPRQCSGSAWGGVKVGLLCKVSNPLRPRRATSPPLIPPGPGRRVPIRLGTGLQNLVRPHALRVPTCAADGCRGQSGPVADSPGQDRPSGARCASHNHQEHGLADCRPARGAQGHARCPRFWPNGQEI